MKTDKERLAEAIHALNELYESSMNLYDFISEAQCNKELRKGLFKDYVMALTNADKVLEGN